MLRYVLFTSAIVADEFFRHPFWHPFSLFADNRRHNLRHSVHNALGTSPYHGNKKVEWMGMLSFSLHRLVPTCTSQLFLAGSAYGLSLIIPALRKVENMIINILDALDNAPSRQTIVPQARVSHLIGLLSFHSLTSSKFLLGIYCSEKIRFPRPHDHCTSRNIASRRWISVSWAKVSYLGFFSPFCILNHSPFSSWRREPYRSRRTHYPANRCDWHRLLVFIVYPYIFEVLSKCTLMSYRLSCCAGMIGRHPTSDRKWFYTSVLILDMISSRFFPRKLSRRWIVVL